MTNTNCPDSKCFNYPRIKIAIRPDLAYLVSLRAMQSESITVDLGVVPPTRAAEECRTIAELFFHHTIVMHPARFPMWRLTNRHAATIKGQPYLGLCTLVATDGVHGFVETPAKPHLFRIHITNFEGKVEPLGTTHSGYKDKSDKKSRVSKAERASAKADELFQELGI